MSNLKEIINNFVDAEFSKSSDNEKSLLKSLTLKKLFSNPYYKDIYYATSVAIKKDKTAAFATNKYDLDDGDYFSVMHNLHNNQLDYTDFDNIEKHLVDKNVYSRLETFIYIAEHYATTPKIFAEKMIEAHKGDSEFFSTLNSFSHIFPDYDYLFFNDNVSKIIYNNDINYIKSDLCKNEIYISSYNDNVSDHDEITKWNTNNEKRKNAIIAYKSSFEDINNYYDQYKKEITIIENHIRKQKPYLFKNTSEQEIVFSYFETEGNKDEDGFSDFILQGNFTIDPLILEKNNVVISDVYSVLPKKEKYGEQSLREAVVKHLLKKDDDITDLLPSRFYGLDFLNDSAIKGSTYSTSYLIAKANDDIVGFISFNSISSDNYSTIKNIGYVCVKENFRSTGLSEKLYDKLASICVDNGNILMNSLYTDQGRDKLPRLKERIREKHPDLLLLDIDIGSFNNVGPEQYCFMQSIKNFNESFKSILLAQQINNPESLKNKVKDIARIHKESIAYINNHRRAFSHDDFEVINFVRTNFIKRQKDKIILLLNEPKRQLKKFL